MKYRKNFKSALDYPNRITTLLFAKLENHAAIRKIVRSLLPDNLSAHLSDCIIKENKLLLYTESAVWASQLRFYSPMIQKIASAQLAVTIDSLQVKVLAHTPLISDRKEKRYPNIPSTATIDYLKKNSQGIQNKELQAALFRLSETLSRKNRRKNEKPQHQ